MNSKEISAAVEPSTATSAVSYWKELVFLVDVQKGYTKRLAEVAARNETIKAYIDGPYGRRLHLDSYDTIILIAGESMPDVPMITAEPVKGGTGVSYIIPLLLDIVEYVSFFRTRSILINFDQTNKNAENNL